MSRIIPMAKLFLAFAISVSTFLPERARSSDLPARYAEVCDRAASVASREFGVPLDLMKAIARTESGITVDGAYVPWPWTINVEGQGKRLRSREDARVAFSQHHSSDVTNIDVGCFQVNHRWHGSNFASVDAMLDPSENARYAAQFLKELHGEFGNWLKAAAAYHSRNSGLSDQYMARLVPILNKLRSSGDGPVKVADADNNPNNFPLLQGTSNSQNRGSLFPTATTSRGSLLMTSDIRG